MALKMALRIRSLVFGGGDARYFLKCAGEISDIAVADHLSHLIHLIAAVGQKLHRLPDSAPGYIGHNRVIRLFLEQMA